MMAAMCLGFTAGREEEGFWVFTYLMEADRLTIKHAAWFLKCPNKSTSSTRTGKQEQKGDFELSPSSSIHAIFRLTSRAPHPQGCFGPRILLPAPCNDGPLGRSTKSCAIEALGTFWVGWEAFDCKRGKVKRIQRSQIVSKIDQNWPKPLKSHLLLLHGPSDLFQ